MSVVAQFVVTLLCATILPKHAVSATNFISLAELNALTPCYQKVTTCGTVVETFQDEIDSKWDFLVLKDEGLFMPIAIAHQTEANPADWLDARISVTGRYHGRTKGSRLFLGAHIIATPPVTNSIRVLAPPPDDAYACEPLDQGRWIAPKDLPKLGRRLVSGVVIARWGGQHFAVRTKQGDTVIVKLRNGNTPPPGLHVQAVGYPETDLYRLSLTRAIYREQSGASAMPPEEPIRVTPEAFFRDDEGHDQLHYSDYNGKLITIAGMIRNISTETAGLHVDLVCKGHALSVDMDQTISPELADLKPRTAIEATGICLMECETWNPNLILPHIKSCRLLVRDAKDIRILTRPPLWTPARLAIIIGILMVGIVGFAVRSAALRAIIHRRSRELLKEQIAHISADLRTDERTRLAAELHDALSQNLEGVAFQIAASKDLMSTSPQIAKQTLDAASHMLLSSRTELKRCLFDLRHNALEESSFDEALRTTLEPIAGNATLSIRFNVRRDIFSDTSAHVVICIIRELVSNAVHHGRARHVRIAGEYHEGTLNFSVRDDGSGFDVSRRPGPDDGHFGIEGIRERVHRLNGVFSIDSKPGGPTRATVTAILVAKSNAVSPSSK